jgi:hypothetical protein
VSDDYDDDDDDCNDDDGCDHLQPQQEQKHQRYTTMAGPPPSPSPLPIAFVTSSVVRKRVRFSHKVVRSVGSRHDYAVEERRSYWYQAEDYQKIHDDCRRCLEEVEDGGWCYELRGLEHQRGAGQERRARIRREASATVLLLQDEGCPDDVIADGYATITSNCQVRAGMVGRNDEREARSIHDDDQDEVNGMGI